MRHAAGIGCCILLVFAVLLSTSFLLSSSFEARLSSSYHCGSGGEVLSHAQGGSRLLVIVIAGGTKPVYTALRGFWRLIRDKAAVDGVVVYLVGYDPSLTTPRLHKGTLVFPGTDSLIPGVLLETLDAVEYIYHNKLPGHDAKHVLRTNLSSFWNFRGLLNWLAHKPTSNYVAAFIGVLKGTEFPAGNGYVLSKDLWLWILDNRGKLPQHIIDDVAVGQLLAKKSLRINPMARQDFTDPAEVPHEFSQDYFFWRVKSNIQTQDIAIFSSLFFFWYGPATQLVVDS